MEMENNKNIIESIHRRDLNITFKQINEILKKYDEKIGDCISFYCENIGFNNKTYFIYTLDNKSLVLRLTKNTWPKEKIECEKELMMYVKNNTKIPIPKILCYESNYEIYGFGWILMEKIDGDNLESLWKNMVNKDKNDITLQIIDILKQLQSLRFNKIGSLYSYGIGPYFENKQGPFYTTKDFLKNKIDISMNLANTKVEFNKIKTFIPQLQKITEEILKNIDNLPIVLFHGDLSLRNILIKNNNIVALLDWEWGGTMPIFSEWINSDIIEIKDYLINKDEIFTKYNIPKFNYIKDIYIIIDNIAPWQVGCFGIEEDKRYITNSINEIIKIIDKYKINI